MKAGLFLEIGNRGRIGFRRKEFSFRHFEISIGR